MPVSRVHKAIHDLLDAMVAEHPDRLKLDPVAVWDLGVEEFAGELTIRIKCQGFRLKKSARKFSTSG